MREVGGEKQKRKSQEMMIKETRAREASAKTTKQTIPGEVTEKKTTARETIAGKTTVTEMTPQRTEPSDSLYYQPKTDSSDSVLMHRIEKYNQHLKYQDYGRKYLLPPAGNV